MALADNLTAEKEALTALLESEYTAQNLRDNLLERLYYVRFLLGELSGSTITNYALEAGGNIESLVTNTQNIIGTESQTAPSSGVIVGGVSDAGNFKHFNLDSSGRVKLAAGTQNIGSITNVTGTVSLPADAATATNQTTEIGYVVNLDGNVTTISNNVIDLKSRLPASLGAKTAANSLSVTPASNATFTLSAESGFLTVRTQALTSTAQTIKTSNGSVMGWNFINVNSSAVYVKFYNALIANVTVGTTTPVLTVAVPAGSATNPGINMVTPDLVPFEVFSTAISFACVTGLADNSNTAPATAIHASVRYK